MIKCPQFYEQYKFHAHMNMKKLYNLVFCLISFLMSQSTIFQLCWDMSTWVEPVLSKDKYVLLKDITQ